MSINTSTNAAINNFQKFVDIPKAIADKNPKLLKILPKFLIRYIQRKIHEEELNLAVNRNKHRFGHDFVDAAMEEFGAKTNVIGIENVPTNGGVIVAANHPLGGLDGIALMDVIGEKRKDIKFFVNDLLMAFKNFAPIFVPVNKLGKNSGDYTKKFEETYSSQDCILIFPAGLVSRKQNDGKIKDLIWKKSFITKSVQYQKDIVPVFIDGTNSDFFYNLAYWRKKIGIKANIEMFFLPDQMYKQRGKTITFIVGKPIAWQTFSAEHTPEYWAEKVKQHVYALKSGNMSLLLTTKKF
jgi:1-acyl-sn-glycerol-3-phosphate acyltransferase